MSFKNKQIRKRSYPEIDQDKLETVEENATVNGPVSLKNLDTAKLTAITKAASGTTTVLNIPLVSAEIVNAGDIIEIVNPVTGEAEEITVATDVLAGATSITIEEIALANSYPVGAFIAVSVRRMFQQLRAQFDFEITPNSYRVKHLVGQLVIELQNPTEYTLPLIRNLSTINIPVVIRNVNQQSAALITQGTDTINDETSLALAKYETVSLYMDPGEYKIY